MQCSAKRPHRFNALKHGVLSRYTVLPWEDAEEYRALVAALVAEHAPQGPTEEHKDSGEFWWGMPSNKDGLNIGKSRWPFKCPRKLARTICTAPVHRQGQNRIYFCDRAVCVPKTLSALMR